MIEFVFEEKKMNFWKNLFIFMERLKKILLLKKGIFTVAGYIFCSLLIIVLILSKIEYISKNIFSLLFFFFYLSLIFYCDKHLNLIKNNISIKSYLLFIFKGAIILFGYFHFSRFFGFSFFQWLFPKYIFEFIFLSYAFLSIIWFAYQKYNKNEERKLKKHLQKCTVMMTLIQTVVSKFSDDGVFCLSILLAAYVYIDYLIEYADNEIEIKKKEGLS